MKIDIQKMAREDTLGILDGTENWEKSHGKYLGYLEGAIGYHFEREGIRKYATEMSREEVIDVFWKDGDYTLVKTNLTDDPRDTNLEVKSTDKIERSVVQYLMADHSLPGEVLGLKKGFS
jgi:hypothetical protein